MKTVKTLAAIMIAALMTGGAASAQSISDSPPETADAGDGLPGEPRDKDGDGVSEGRSFDGPGGSDVSIEGHSEPKTKENPKGDTGVTIGIGSDF